MGPKWFREVDIAECEESLDSLLPEAVDAKPMVIIIDQFDDIVVTAQRQLIVSCSTEHEHSKVHGDSCRLQFLESSGNFAVESWSQNQITGGP